MEKKEIIRGLETCMNGFCGPECPYSMNEPDVCRGKCVRDVKELIDKLESTLGFVQKVDGIYFLATGSAAEGERRGTMLGMAKLYEHIRRRLFIEGLLTKDIAEAIDSVYDYEKDRDDHIACGVGQAEDKNERKN